ncbi:MAG: hypothetical protein Q9222_007395, partial [Ikaeria aurantiellina]
MDHFSSDSLAKDSTGPDVENSFFRSWALRAPLHQYSSSSDISPGSRTPITSPISPRAVVRPRRPDLPRSESHSTNSHVSRLEFTSSPRVVARDIETTHRRASKASRPQRRSTKSRGSLGSLGSQASRTVTFVARRVSKGLQWPASHESPKKAAEEPASPAKPHVVWKREVSGHWLEIRLGKRTKQEIKEPEARSPKPVHTPHPSPVTAPQTPGPPRKSTNASKAEALLGLGQSLHGPSETLSSDSNAKKSIASLTKRFWGSRHTAHSEQSQAHSNSPTSDLLSQVTAALRELLERGGLTPSSSSTSNSNLSAASIAGRPKDKLNKNSKTLLRPAYRRHRTGHSSSSSVRRLKLGNPPVNTPNPENMYTGSDAQQYFRVELTDPNAPKYLPSEARRIGTPPLPNQGSKLRGFFFDYNAPRSSDGGGAAAAAWPHHNLPPTSTIEPLPQRPPPLTTPTIPRSPGTRIQRNDSDVEWFRVK